MKRVLVITYYWPPAGGSGVQRWVKFAKYLPGEDWQPVIYTPENPELTSVDKTLADDIPPEAEILKTRITEPYRIYRSLTGKSREKQGEVNPISGGKKSLFQKLSLFIRGNFFIPDPRCFWVRPSVKYLLRYLKDHPVDIIVSTGPPHSMHLIAMKVAQATKLPWIADFRDPWTRMFYFKHLHLTSWARRRHIALERQVLDSASAIVTVTKPLQQEFQSMTSTPVHCITNGYDESDFRQIIEPDGFFNITHTGLFAADGNPETLWKVLEDKCRTDSEFRKLLRIRLVGKTDREITESVMEHGLAENLRNLGYQTHQVATREQMGASVLLLPQRKEPEYKAVLTGKIFEYLASGHPILAIGMTDCAMADVIRETHSGVMLDWDDYGGIRKFLDDCWEKFKSDEPESENADISGYSRKELTGRMARLMESLLEQDGTGRCVKQ